MIVLSSSDFVVCDDGVDGVGTFSPGSVEAIDGSRGGI